MTLKVIDLFCGCGGMSKGLTDAGLEVVAGIDIWKTAIESYKKNFKHHGICKDLTEYSPEQLIKDIKINKDEIDMICGGFPCQSFSMAGKRDSKDSRNNLFEEYIKYVNYFNPKVIMFENVIGILSMKNEKREKIIDIIMKQLNVKYNCIICKLYASDFEVPQNRRRVIMIGIRKDLKKFPTEPKIVSKERKPVKDVLEKEEYFVKKEEYKKYFLSKKALEGIKRKKEKSKKEGKGFGAQFLDLNKPSYTIPARYWKDGYDALVKYNEEVRRLTILELKRIQSFPDDYILTGNRKDQIMQIGNAVACRFAYYLGKHIINMIK